MADARQAVQQVLKMRKKVEMKVVWVLSGASRERRTQPVGVSMERRMWPAEVMEVESLEASGQVVALGGVPGVGKWGSDQEEGTWDRGGRWPMLGEWSWGV